MPLPPSQAGHMGPYQAVALHRETPGIHLCKARHLYGGKRVSGEVAPISQPLLQRIQDPLPKLKKWTGLQESRGCKEENSARARKGHMDTHEQLCPTHVFRKQLWLRELTEHRHWTTSMVADTA